MLFGDLFRVFSPWRAFRFPGLRPYPERWGRYPAALALLAFTWIELVSGWGEDPALLVSIALGYTAYTLAMQVAVRHGDVVGARRGLRRLLQLLLAHLAVGAARTARSACARRSAACRGWTRSPARCFFVVVMIGTVTFDGLSQGSLWTDLSVDIARAVDGIVGAETAPKVAGTVGLLLAVGLVGLFYRLGIDGARSVGGDLDAPTLRRDFIHTLVPIALVYVAAHYLTFLLFEGQAFLYLASDPFGQGWDLFGTASRAIDYTYLSQNAAWYLQVAFVVLGHVAALILAHDRALALYKDARLAVRSQYWMLRRDGRLHVARALAARQAPARDQTALTSSSSATRNEEPQPQAAITFGLSTLKPAPCMPST